MTPTRYPGWRIWGFLLGIISVMAICIGTLVYLRRPPSWISMTWAQRDPNADLSRFLSLLLSSGLTAMGALTSAWRPARGFLVMGAGHLCGAVSMVILFLPAKDMLKQAVSALACGILYTWLGFRQLEADRSTSE
jgi:hypothetical protein